MAKSTEEQVVLAFCQAWENRSLDDVLAAMAEDIVYQNVPAPVMEGRDAAKEFIAPILEKAAQIDFELTNIAVRGDRVLTERIDRLYFVGGTVEIPLMGIFVVRDGKIAEWRDYADSGNVNAQFAKLS